MSEQEIDRILADSYPASDPPSWTLGVETPGAPQQLESEDLPRS